MKDMVNFEEQLMNILILTHSYPDSNNPWRGVFVQEQAKALSLQHDVTVVFFKTDYSRFAPFSGVRFTKKESSSLHEYEVVTARSFPVINQVKYLRDTFLFIRRELTAVKKFDLIHSHLSYPAGFLGTIIQKLLKIPNITTEHSWIRKHFRSVIHKKCVMYSLKNSKGYIAVSDALRKDIRSVCERDVYVVPNVIEPGRFRLSEKKRGLKLELGLLGGMGNYRKGLDILIEALAIVKNRNVLVHVGGDGNLLPVFRKLAEDKGVSDLLIFHGGVPADKTPEFYSKLDCFVLPSRDETFGVVVIEAMASGLPVIASDCGGPREIITPETGILIAKEDPSGLAAAIDLMQENSEKYDRHAIRNYVSDRYSPEAFIRTLNNVYAEVLANGFSRAK